MLYKNCIALSLAVGLIFAVVASAKEGRAREDTRPGRAEYIEMGCYQCHGYEGQGARPTGSRLAPEPLPFEAFSTWVRHPPEVMPAYSPNVLGEDKLKRIHDYLVSIPAPPDISTLSVFAEE